MSDENSKIEEGTIQNIDGIDRIHIGGRDIKYQNLPTRDSIQKHAESGNLNEKQMDKIVEHAIATTKLSVIELMKARFHRNVNQKIDEADPSKIDDVFRTNHVKAIAAEDELATKSTGALLAGALFNRITNNLEKAVTLREHIATEDKDKIPEDQLVENQSKNELYFSETSALISKDLAELGNLSKHLTHRNGLDSLEEMVGEPAMAFAQPLKSFYEHRYRKLSSAMDNIEELSDVITKAITLKKEFKPNGESGNLVLSIRDFKDAAIAAIETSKREAEHAEIHGALDGAALNVIDRNFQDNIPKTLPDSEKDKMHKNIEIGEKLLNDYVSTIMNIVDGRVSLPSAQDSIKERAESFKSEYVESARTNEIVSRRL